MTRMPLQSFPVEFSGKKAVAVEKNGELYIYDTGSKFLYSLELSTGKMTGKIAVEQSFEHIAGQNGMMIGINGTKIYRLAESGTAEKVADITTLPVNKSIYNSLKKAYDPLAQVPENIQEIKVISVDTSGNLFIRDSIGALWRVNLFE